MEGLQKKVLSEIVICWQTIVLTTLSASSFLLSLAAEKSNFGLYSFLLLLTAVGFAATRFVCQYEAIFKETIEKLQEDKQLERNLKLDTLDAKLLEDKDPRDQTALRNLRVLYDNFLDDFRNGRISPSVPASMLDQIEHVAENCIFQLEQQYKIWQTSRRVSGDMREKLLNQKTAILDEVEASVENLSKVMDEVRILGLKAKQGDLKTLQKRLKIQLEAAKSTDAFFTEAGNPDAVKYSEYSKYAE